MNKTIAAILFGAAMTGLASGEPMTYKLPDETAHFKDAPGVEAVQAHCSACHSSDYIATQPSRQGEKFWTAEANKMIKVYGASIDPSAVDAIAKYLATNY